MADKVWNQSADVTVKPVLERSVAKIYNRNTVSIISLTDATVKITGTVTKKQYVFSGAGSKQDVDIQDKDEILNKKRGRACCGGQSGTSLFELA